MIDVLATLGVVWSWILVAVESIIKYSPWILLCCKDLTNSCLYNLSNCQIKQVRLSLLIAYLAKTSSGRKKWTGS